MMRFKINYYWLAALIPLLFILWFVAARNKNEPVRTLPYYGPANNKSDSSHIIPAFTFTSQYGEPVTERTVKDKVYVTEFFFTTCQTICPVMNDHLVKVYKKFRSEPRFLILSHTVDPEFDSVPVLKAYAGRHGVNDRQWLFVTGAKKQLYQMARKAYLLDTGVEPAGEEDFVHTQNFALVDARGRLRGFYDGTDSLEIERLITEIKVLLNETETLHH
jgi:protein SCO1